MSDAALFERPIVITNAAYRFMVLEQLAEIGLEADVLLEPMRRDSGPAIAAGAAFAQMRDKDAVVLALAADHVVRDTAAFVAACRAGPGRGRAGRIVTFGVEPERAATEYGYISPGEAISGEVRSVAKFVEKPDPATAAEYIKAGYLWNSGNFMFRASVLLDEYRNVDAESVQAVTDAVTKAGRDLGFVTLDAAAFGSAKAISIDYAVMEKTRAPPWCRSRAAGPMSAPGMRCGSCRTRMVQGNAAQGTAVFEDSRNCNVSTEGALVALEGVDDLVVVATQDAVLVSRQKDANGLKRLVAKLKTVAPAGHRRTSQGASAVGLLSIGRHGRAASGQAHRGEAGRPALAAETSPSLRALDRGARCGARDRQRMVKTVHENESIYIPIGAVHRLENPGKILLELIEVQTGSYLGEDDIIRIEDDYRRS